jgi:hypothetical protein
MCDDELISTATYGNNQVPIRRQQVIIKHVIELETVINEEVNELSVYKIKGMSEEQSSRVLY